MSTVLDNRNNLAMEMLVACDQAYIYGTPGVTQVFPGSNVVVDTPLGELRDSTGNNDVILPYALPDSDFKVAQVIEDRETGFKCLIYRHNTRDEIIVAMAGTDGPDMQDWAQNLKWGWKQWFDFEQADLEKRGRNLVFKAMSELTNPATGWTFNPATTQIHFTGQSLGGALAEYAAFDFWRQNRETNPDLLSRLTLTTFNGLAGGAGMARFGGATADELAAFRPARTAHYEVTNDLVNRLGGAHLAGAGNIYRLDFRSDKTDPATGQPYLLDPVDAHRIESAYYRTFARQLAQGDNRLFDQATPYTDWTPLPVDGLQAEPGYLISLFNKGTVTEESGRYRAVAGLVYALDQATRTRDIDALFKPLLDMIEKSDLAATKTGRALLPLAQYLTAEDLKGAANDAPWTERRAA